MFLIPMPTAWPTFLDLDSDNDGMADAIEANNGITPSTAFNTATLQYNYDPAFDTDGDGLMAAIDNIPGQPAALLPFPILILMAMASKI